MSDPAPAAAPATCLTLDGRPLTLSQVHHVATRKLDVELVASGACLERVRAAEQLVGDAVTRGWPVYGVTTGFGGMADLSVGREEAAASQNNLLSFLATGAGRPVDRRHVRAAMLLRANVLLRGCSGVRLELIERLVRFLQADAIPIVREYGSIGASGDLVPLAAIARAITGRSNAGRVVRQGEELDAAEVLTELGLAPLELQPKEGLAIVNGTSFSAAVAANCVARARVLLGTAMAVNVMMLRALNVHDEAFDAFVHECKPHPGQIWVAAEVLRLLRQEPSQGNGKGDHIQDRYALRCFPQYLGPVIEGLAGIARRVTIEMNSVSDNPLVDTERQIFCQSGNFLGQYIAVAMDELRRHIGLTAKHLDVQIAQLVAPEFSRGLPPSLRGREEPSYNMGLKGLQITGNSIMPLLTWHANPLLEHFPTHAEQFNQNVNGLSWGAAQLAWQSLDLFQHYLGVSLIFAIQACDLRARLNFGHCDGRALLGEELQEFYRSALEVLGESPQGSRPLLADDADRCLEKDLSVLSGQLDAPGPIRDAIDPLLASLDRFLASER